MSRKADNATTKVPSKVIASIRKTADNATTKVSSKVIASIRDQILIPSRISESTLEVEVKPEMSSDSDKTNKPVLDPLAEDDTDGVQDRKPRPPQDMLEGGPRKGNSIGLQPLPTKGHLRELKPQEKELRSSQSLPVTKLETRTFKGARHLPDPIFDNASSNDSIENLPSHSVLQGGIPRNITKVDEDDDLTASGLTMDYDLSETYYRQTRLFGNSTVSELSQEEIEFRQSQGLPIPDNYAPRRVTFSQLMHDRAANPKDALEKVNDSTYDSENKQVFDSWTK